MSVVQALRQLVLGETWTLPVGVLGVLIAGAGLRHALPHAWHDVGGLFLLAGVIAVLVLAVALSARRTG